jgi:NUMOD4 motif/HNH endonuclease
MINEVWLPVNGYEGSYEVSNLGRVKSIDRSFKNTRGEQRTYKGIDRAIRFNRGGYAVVGLRDRKKKLRLCTVHRLVAIAFIPNPGNKPQINHVDGGKTNNVASNLEWATGSENTKHAYATELAIGSKGTKNGQVKLTPELVLKGKKLRELGWSYAAIAPEVGVSEKTIYKAINGLTWKHLS